MVRTRSGTAASAVAAKIGTDTVKRRASKGATERHIKCVCGNPCSKRTAGPDPKRRRKILVSSACNSIASKSSNVVGLVITRPPSDESSDADDRVLDVFWEL